MKRTLKIMFLSVEVNLILWLVVAVMLFAPPMQEQTVRTAAVAGLAFAAVAQHWAYYAVYRRARQMPH